MNKIDLRLENLPQANEVRNFGKANKDIAKNGGSEDFSRLLDNAQEVQDNSSTNQKETTQTETNNQTDNAENIGQNDAADKKTKKAQANGENNVVLALIFPEAPILQVSSADAQNAESANVLNEAKVQIAITQNQQNANALPVEGEIANQANGQAAGNQQNISGNLLSGEAAKQFELALKKLGAGQNNEAAATPTSTKATNSNNTSAIANEGENSQTPNPTTATDIEIAPTANKNSQAINLDFAKIEKPQEDKKSQLPLENIGAENGKTNPVAQNEVAAKIESNEPKLAINNIQAIAATMVKKFQNGDKKFFVRLDPPELGKIEVELKISPDNKITALLKSENPQAMGELMKSARDLVNSLNQAGFDMKESDLSFSLNQNGHGQQNNNNQAQGQAKIFNFKNQIVEDVAIEIAPPKSTKIHHETWDRTRVSMVI